MNKQKLDFAIRIVVSELLQEIRGVRAIVLFGSHATGQAREDSDVDLLVVTEKEWEDGIEVSHELIDGWTVELTFIGRATLEADAREGNPFALSALTYGKAFYDDGTWQQVQAVRASSVSSKRMSKLVEQAKERLAQNDLQAAMLYAANVQALLEGETTVTFKPERLARWLLNEPLASETVTRLVEEVEARLYGTTVS